MSVKVEFKNVQKNANGEYTGGTAIATGKFINETYVVSDIQVSNNSDNTKSTCTYVCNNIPYTRITEILDKNNLVFRSRVYKNNDLSLEITDLILDSNTEKNGGTFELFTNILYYIYGNIRSVTNSSGVNTLNVTYTIGNSQSSKSNTTSKFKTEITSDSTSTFETIKTEILSDSTNLQSTIAGLCNMSLCTSVTSELFNTSTEKSSASSVVACVLSVCASMM